MNVVTYAPIYQVPPYHPSLWTISIDMPHLSFSSRDCTITWNATRRPVDITASLLTSTYVAALMVEDFVDITSMIPMSSVPLQM